MRLGLGFVVLRTLKSARWRERIARVRLRRLIGAPRLSIVAVNHSSQRGLEAARR